MLVITLRIQMKVAGFVSIILLIAFSALYADEPEAQPKPKEPAKVEIIPETGWITVDSEPTGMPVLIDGKPVANTKLVKFSATAGAHIISIEAPGYIKTEIEIKVAKGLENEIMLKLQPVAQAQPQPQVQPAAKINSEVPKETVKVSEKSDKEKAPEVKEMRRPYLGIAIGCFVFSIAATATGFYFNSTAKSEYDSYNKMKDPAEIVKAMNQSGFNADDYAKKADNHYSNGEKDTNSMIYSFVGAGLFLGAGIALLYFKEEVKSNDKQPVSLLISKDGAMVNLSMNF